jgi:inner membrane protease subunit 1|eukprot:scaffold609_cov198-Alexandrium_tamarense.AAC.52
MQYSDDYFPYYPFRYAVDIGIGPSMLPTLRPGELYLRDCWSTWFKRPYSRGDVVTLYNPFSKAIVCKRIIGLEGDTVRVFGEYAGEYYSLQNDGDLGVPYDERYPQQYCRTVAGNGDTQHTTTISIPPNHVWLEGDNPLESTDSRHYGPLPVSSLRGRLDMRLWPIRRDTKPNEQSEEKMDSTVLSSKRPNPIG